MNRTTTIILTLGLAVAALSAVSCGPEASAQGAAAAPPPATVATPLVRPVAVTRELPALIEATERVELHPQVSGAIESVHFEEGSRVTKGQLLFRIDPRPFAARLAEAEATLAQAEADAAAAQREDERSERLAQRKAIAQEQAEKRRASALVAAARVDAAKAAVDKALLDLSYTEVRSPITGRIGRAEITRGNLVGPQSRLATIVATDSLWVTFDLEESALGSGGTASVDGWAVTFTMPAGKSWPAEIAFTENEIGQGTGTLRIRARMANHDGSLIPGMYGTVTLTLGENPSAILVREAAIGADQGQRYVLITGEGDILEYRSVTLGARLGELRVITSGLEPSDQVVVDGLVRLRPGMPVTPSVVSMEKES